MCVSVPTNFYNEMWLVVERCQGISVGAELLANTVTHEMTAGEMKVYRQNDIQSFTV